MPKKFAIKGTIIPTEYQRIYDYYGFEGTSPGKLAAFLEEAGNEEVVLEINSPGGYVYAGMEMYNRLKLHSAKVTALVLSIAASAASVICCAAAEVQMMPVSQMMIHRAHSWAVGDKNDIYKTAEDLEKLDDTIANAYVDKTKLSKDKITALMDVTTWMGPEEAKKLGFADTILFREEEQPAMACDGVVMLSKAQILKLKERMDAEIQANEQQNSAALDLLRQKYNYLNLKGEEN